MKKVWFRFYEELNAFLPSGKRKVSFEYFFTGNPSVKDTIEAIGVPHVEVDLILVNGTAVDFSYKIRENDNISVYPVFESFDISQVSPLWQRPLREIKFILDVHLGKLAKYIRLCGFDTLYETDLDDSKIIEISVNEKRIILTRDKELLKNKRVTHGYWLRSQRPVEQVREVFRRFDLRKLINPFTRCLECNSILESVQKENIIERLQPDTRKYYNVFKKCPSCDRLYWEGSHFEKMRMLIDNLTDTGIDEGKNESKQYEKRIK
jgi:uncharacterized protein with PIN domain